MAAPHCLPCHASNPAYWLELASAGNAASRAALLSRLATPGGAAGLAGCPCTPALACAAAAQDASAGGEGHRTALLRCMEGATHRHFIAPAGGVALSRGLLQRMGRLELPQLAEVLGGLASAVHNMNAAEAGFELLSRLLWDAGHAVTRTMDLDPATHWWHPTSRFGRLPTAAPPPPSQGALPAGGAPLGQGPAAAGRLADDRTLSSAAAEVLRSACLPPLCTRDFLRMVSSSLAREQQGPSRALYDSITSAVALAARLHNTSSSFPIQPGITAATTSNALNASSTNASNPTTTACDQQAAATGGATQRRPFYTVETCLSNYPGKACPVIEACVKDTTCVMPGSGSFNWAVEEEEAFYSYMNFIPRPPPGFQKKVEFQSTSLLLTLQLAPRPYGPPNRTSCLNPDAPASWFSGQWHRNTTFLANGTASANGTYNSTLTNNTSSAVNGTQAEDAGEDCVFHRLPRRRIVELLSGKKVFFTGDSLNRQLYHRLIWYLRGMEAVMEHYYHEQAVYVYYWNDTDSFKIGPDLLSNYSAPLAPHERFKLFYVAGSQLKSRGAVLGTLGCRFFIHPTYNYSLVADAKPDIMVVGSIAQFYYGKEMGNLTRLHVDTLLRNISSLGGPKHYFWLMFQDGELAHSPWISQSAIEFGQRARALHARLQPEVKNINFQILPYDTMSGVPTPWRRNEQEKETWRTFGAQGLHFQCSVYPPYPEPITGFKAPPTLDCTDGMDLELNFLWLNSALRWAELNPGQW
ncbi:hypothetical protein HYH03_013265 [Edaphochlamys debaryana]|uniref:Uncharacterized protein n=1 Tax=Edaphochlamys debaryana TaxID=47281 RepID=A0A835XNF2_9CHLO|nr:hypothetical protein HYH03_013265 [Edaphochlamys debaryana]|eukprot:KAG2488117.1 hypothetical protein HYH03_013265 [Edaphochlamys debaryana]